MLLQRKRVLILGEEMVVKDCERQIQHWEKVSGDYEALKERLESLPDKLCYDIMVPFGPMAFMPGKLVHTNEVTVLLGDNWFAKCSTKQAEKIVDHRMKYVKNELCGLSKTMTNFESRVEMVKDWENIVNEKGDYVDIREVIGNNEATVTKGKRRVAHRPHSKPKLENVLDLEEENEGSGEETQQNGCTKTVMTEEDLWARLDELEKLEQIQNERDRLSDNADLVGEDTSSSSSEEQNETDSPPENGLSLKLHNTAPPCGELKEDLGEHYNLPTIYFSHTVEPKKVRINTSKNTTLKFSERKEQKEHSKRKKKNGHQNGRSHHEVHRIETPADIYRLFVDVKDGEPMPKKSILKSRSRENSVCSDTSESSAADVDERRMMGRSFSHDENTPSDNSDSLTEDDSSKRVPLHRTGHFEAFSGTVVEKEPIPLAVPFLTIGPPTLPTIMERKLEEIVPDVETPQHPVKPMSKFKAARMQQK
ncbi:unconventional prefoldin RPB5 interactor 1 isoform X3 [Syngnathoides biaculeatus]|uniref:unconventional prefoldin RPB5 interactor 1 isoform X3 n=1 Tax=Syngnathoides biaculeatus TaxID=300417 RepID=UPI002ADE6F1F|nr:unconventional prefoldin RPB5 interactor 1 isoform X3 [Syngnathoides biaculeatus]